LENAYRRKAFQLKTQTNAPPSTSIDPLSKTYLCRIVGPDYSGQSDALRAGKYLEECYERGGKLLEELKLLYQTLMSLEQFLSSRSSNGEYYDFEVCMCIPKTHSCIGTNVFIKSRSR
jgi:hypothetical protein